MLFPRALILHVAREPMDTIFSAYKHEFPAGPLDYTSSFDSLAELYHGTITSDSCGFPIPRLNLPSWCNLRQDIVISW